MPVVHYNPEAANRAFLAEAGIYGPGQEHEADVTIYSVALAEPGSLDAPYDDKDCSRDSYTMWTFQVVHGGKVCFARSRAQANTLPNSGSRNLAWFKNLGVIGEADDQGNVGFDLDKLVGIKCVVKVAKPRRDKNDPYVWYTGAVTDVFAIPGKG